MKVSKSGFPKIAFIVICMLSFSLAMPHLSLAEKKSESHGQKQQKTRKHSRENQIIWSDDAVKSSKIKIDLADRAVIQSYLRGRHAKGCPPGLAKKNNGCMPPGLAKKYHVGAILPDDVILLPVPGELLKYLHPAPKGYMYASVDKDILLIAEASKKVIDAVTLLSAVGN